LITFFNNDWKFKKIIFISGPSNSDKYFLARQLGKRFWIKNNEISKWKFWSFNIDGSNSRLFFDNYKRNEVVLFEEFRSQIPFNAMLQILDGYPIYVQIKDNTVKFCSIVILIISIFDYFHPYKNVSFEGESIL
jgi:hypothetical protein